MKGIILKEIFHFAVDQSRVDQSSLSNSVLFDLGKLCCISGLFSCLFNGEYMQKNSYEVYILCEYYIFCV